MGESKVLSELSYYQDFTENIFKTKIETKPKLIFTNKIEGEAKKNNIGLVIGGAIISRWPISYWIDIIKYLENKKWNIYLFGGKNVYKDSQKIANNCKNLTGSLSISESLKYLKKISLLIGNDTGFTHFASLIIPKCLIIQGGGTFGRFFPWPKSTNQYILYHALDCFDCNWNCKFSNTKCINKIQPSHVIDYLEEIINSKDTDRNRNLNKLPTTYNIWWRFLKDKKLKVNLRKNSTTQFN